MAKGKKIGRNVSAGKGGTLAKLKRAGVIAQAGRTKRPRSVSPLQRKEGAGTGARTGKIRKYGNLAG